MVSAQTPEAPRHSDAERVWVECVTGLADLRARVREWDELAACAVHPNPFYESAMVLPALEQYGKHQPVELVLVYAPHPTEKRGPRQLCAFIPIVRKRSKVALGAEVAELWQYPLGYLCTPLLREGYLHVAWNCFLDWMTQKSHGKVIIKCDNVHDQGRFGELIVDTLSEREWPYAVVDRLTRALLVRTPNVTDADTYLMQALGGKRRKELRRQRSRLAEQGALTVDVLDQPGDVARYAEEFLALELTGWKGKEQTAMSSHAEDRAFFLCTIETMFRQNRLLMSSLRLDGKPIAMKCNLLSPPGSFAWRITYDEKFAAYSPGVQLEIDNLERFFARTELSFMDSCASRNRVMINRLWTARQRMQTVLFGTGATSRALLLAAQPLFGLTKRALRRGRGAKEKEKE